MGLNGGASHFAIIKCGLNFVDVQACIRRL